MPGTEYHLIGLALGIIIKLSSNWSHFIITLFCLLLILVDCYRAQVNFKGFFCFAFDLVRVTINQSGGGGGERGGKKSSGFSIRLLPDNFFNSP